MMEKQDLKRRLQGRVDELARRMLIDSNDLDFETHLRQKKELEKIMESISKNSI